MDKKTIQRRRIMKYFIDAAYEVIESRGLENATIREVADIAGYNSATIYNYFDTFDHLIFYASLKYLKEYIKDLDGYLKSAKNSLEKFLNVWKCFCIHSLTKPQIYYNIFFGKYSNKLNHDIEEYYSIFPEELGELHDDAIRHMLLGQNIYDRNMAILKSCADEGLIKCQHLEGINEMTVLIYHGMIARLMNGQTDYSWSDATEKILFYIKQILKSYGCMVN